MVHLVSWPSACALCVCNSGLVASGNWINFQTWKNSKTCYQIYPLFTLYYRNVLQGKVNISRATSSLLLAWAFGHATHSLVRLSLSVVPVVRGSARTTRTSATRSPIFVPMRCRTTTYQRSFFIRTTRIWNLLTGRMDLANATLTSFKSLLYDYYSRAVRTNYNLDNPKTFKLSVWNATP